MINVLQLSRRLLTAKHSCKLTSMNVIVARAKTVKPHTTNKLTRGAKMPRCWMPIKQEQGPESCSAASGDLTKRYKLLSYNILAQDLLIEHLHLYLKIEPELLTWEYRLQNLTVEILTLAPDILCLQEMQFDHLEMLVSKIKCKRNLQYVFKKKTGFRTDGCAIIYDKLKFTLLEEHAIEYYTADDPLLNRHNVALLAKFHPNDEPTKVFVVATTHLLYNPRRDDVRTAQIQVLLKALATFSANVRGDAFPVLLTGDFNCMPFTPPYHELLTAIDVPPQVPTETTTTDTKTATATQQTTDESRTTEPPEPAACSHLRQANTRAQLQLLPVPFGSSTASTYQDHWITVDYILHSIGVQRENIKIWSVYKLPSVSECRRIGPIPNTFQGSDHYSLALTFSV